MPQDMYKLSEGWEWKKLGEITTTVTKGTTPTSNGFKFQHKGINFIKVENLGDTGIVRESISTFICEDAHSSQKRSQLKAGDLLFSIAGTIGKTALVDESILPANTNQALALIRGYEAHSIPQYLLYCLKSEALGDTRNKKRGGALQNISLADIKNATIPLPPRQEQNRIVEHLDALSARIQALEKTSRERLDHLAALKASLLDAAFRGEL